MGTDLPILYYLGYALHALGHLALLVACIILVIKQKSLATIMMLLGTVLTIIFTIGSLFWNRFVASNDGALSLIEAQGLQVLFGGLANLLFVIGLLLLAITYVRRGEKP